MQHRNLGDKPFLKFHTYPGRSYVLLSRSIAIIFAWLTYAAIDRDWVTGVAVHSHHGPLVLFEGLQRTFAGSLDPRPRQALKSHTHREAELFSAISQSHFDDLDPPVATNEDLRLALQAFAPDLIDGKTLVFRVGPLYQPDFVRSRRHVAQFFDRAQ